LYPIEFDTLLKGSIVQRRGVAVRQFGVYVNGAVRLVTSGDRVDRETYEALVAEGAIQPPQEASQGAFEVSENKAPRVVVDAGVEMEY
jgi:hypothetical protein